MNCQFQFDEKQFDAQDKLGVNFMPFTVKQSCKCESEKYFKPQNDKVIIHGRELSNTKIKPPKPLYIFQKEENVNVIRTKVDEVNLWTRNPNEVKQGQQMFEFISLMGSKVSVASTYTIGESITSLDVCQEYTAAGLLDETVALWKGQVSKENEPSRLEGHSLGIIDVKFSNNGQLLAVSSLDSMIRIWNLNKSIKQKEIVCEQMENWNICWLKDYLCTAGEGGKLSIFNMDKEQEEIPQFSVENSFASSINANNSNIIVGTDSGTLHVVEDPIEKRKLHSKKIHKKMIRSLKFSNDGYKAFTGSDDGEIRLTDLTKMKDIKTFVHHSPVNSIDVNPIDDKLVVSCSSDYKVRLWDTTSGQCIEQFNPFDKKDDRIWSVRFNRDGSQIGVCSQQGQLSFYSRN